MVTLLDLLKVKGITFKNRIVMPPMQTSLATIKGAVTDELVEHYIKRSKNLGCLIVEHSYVSYEGRFNDRQLGIYDNSLIAGLQKLSSSIHSFGTPIVIQINHSGSKTCVETAGIKPVAPSSNKKARRLKIEEIETLVEAFGVAAERAVVAGFDGVEIHGAHGFLLNQFFSPITNRRRDFFGGSLKKRMKFPLEVVERVKEKMGNKLLLYRLGSDDLDYTGTKIKDSQKLAGRLEESGVDIIDVSGGVCGSRPTQLQNLQGYFVPQAEQIKKVVDIPVIGVGGITDPEYADKLIKEKRVDLVAVGRALLEDADWATRANNILNKS